MKLHEAEQLRARASGSKMLISATELQNRAVRRRELLTEARSIITDLITDDACDHDSGVCLCNIYAFLHRVDMELR